ncbi:guanylate kinase [Actinosynnema pretiosum subsp. pretiosum]|uniref:Guanylate kinase n=3 Tax=Actinosynnema TaxID=40566 RepID=C6W8Y7_ACTMD|nr:MULTISPECIES: guanylate kinase [Actinosynnema]ACU39059.1 guanylate kinase [Actinosynnema mirum DSM 43827]ATE56309.1 guanylate kinase [Actinosynnema pretiosum]AXX32653.1 Guanylate kinase [Actinosynnema pretiosum subsp. pretiosum]QUF03460.1 guanylate kinase [Actinosynnema pretiosum subsp. pretiosum]
MSDGTGAGSGVRARPRLTVLSGPSGVGKSSVLAELRGRDPELHYSVSVTTRKPRPGELDGVHYHFVDGAEFDRMVDAGELLEHAEFAGNRYGTPRAPVEAALASGLPSLLEIELQGARQVRAAMPEARLVMLAPPSWEDLVARLTGRGTEDPAVVERRLAIARQELAAEPEFDEVVVNDDVRSAATKLLDLVVGPLPGA